MTDIIKPGQLVWAEYAWHSKTRIDITGHDILCMYVRACYDNHYKYHSYDELLYGDQIIHAYPNRIRKFDGI